MPRTRSKTRVPILLVAALLASACAHLENLPKLQPEDLRFHLAQSSKIFDANGRLITTLHRGQNRTNVTLDQIPEVLQEAVISIEDERFYEHGGVDLKAIFRAALENASSGEIEQGGSTITQQYVKNVIIAPGEIAEQTLDRKLQEAALARQIEKELSKKEILERYLNTVYFGQGAYGVQAASKVYFGKPVSQVTLREAAMLAGLVQAPGDYDPFQHGNAARRRRDVVLRQMAELGYVDEAKADEASRKGLGLQPVKKKDEYPAPYFVDYVQRMLTYHPDFDFLGKTSAQRTKRLFTGGLRIYTTVDLEMQAAAEQAVASVLTEPSDPYASLVAMEPDTGHVKAMVGGRDWFAPPKQDRFAKLNLAILAEPELGRVKVSDKKYLHQAPGTGRQAGSAFKPFALAAAIEDGVPLSKRYDGSGPLVIPGADNGGDYTVQNYEGGQYGEITLLEATVNSVNVVYAQLVEEIGADPVVDIAQRMGIRTPLQPYFSAVLGTNEVNPLGMASAYGTLANNGDHHPPVAVTKIVDASNEEKKKVIYRDETEMMDDILDAGAAYLTTSALQEVIRRGTGAKALGIARPAAGKTGTAQEYRDAWFVGYTPNLVAAVWVGYPQGQIEMKTSCYGSTSSIGGIPKCLPTRITVTGGSWPTEIWTNFMTRALSGYPVEDFPVPEEGIIRVTIDTRNGCLADKFTPDEYVGTGVFASGTEPEESCRVPGDRKLVENLIGFPRAQAIRILEGEGFNVVTEAVPLGSYPPGTVVDQDPAGGSKVPAGSTVTLYISSEDVEETATVPNVLGLSRDEAESRLRSAGFDVDVIVESESSRGRAKKNRGRVWKQAPGEGAELEQGDTVTIWVNPG